MREAPLLIAIAAAAATLAVHRTAAAACSIHGTATVVTYWSDSSPYDPVRPGLNGDMRCTYGWVGTRTCKLVGVYVVPTSVSGTTKLPTIVFVHGSGDTQGYYCTVMNDFLDRGYAFFYPMMRGVSLVATVGGATVASSGTEIEDWAAAQDTSVMTTTQWLMQAMEDETMDVDAALRAAVAQPHADATRLALIGHSYGGARVTIAAAAPLGVEPQVTVSLSGAGMSYVDGDAWADELVPKAGEHRMPIYFQRVLNESPGLNFDSAIQPFDAAIATGAARLAAYSPYQTDSPTSQSATSCNDAPWHIIHCAFVLEPEGIARWFDGVIEFLDDYGVK